MANMQWADRIGRRLKLRDLHVLFAVMQWGSMAKAAHHLAVSQPVVSAAIAGLEQTLGVRLLDRGRRGVEPTIYGRALLNHGLAAFDALRQGVKEIEFLADPTVGELRIGCPEWIAAGLLPTIIDRLLQRHPRVVFHVDQTITATQEFRELRERRLDLVLGRIAAPFIEEDLHAEILYQEQLRVIAGVRSPWARRRKIELSELLGEPWLLTPPNELPGSLVAEAFRASGLTLPQPKIVSFSLHLRSRLLATGRYLAVVPGSLLHFTDSPSPLKVLPIKLPVGPRPVAIVSLKNRTLSPVAKLFIDCAREVTKPLAKAASSSSHGIDPHR
jgi:DNA-binding transcriptional LysR family regulator